MTEKKDAARAEDLKTPTPVYIQVSDLFPKLKSLKDELNLMLNRIPESALGHHEIAVAMTRLDQAQASLDQGLNMAKSEQIWR